MTANKQKAIKELKRVEFSIHRVIVMMENRENCFNIIRESGIAQDALKRASRRILFYHLERCFRELLRGKKDKENCQEIMRIFKINGR